MTNSTNPFTVTIQPDHDNPNECDVTIDTAHHDWTDDELDAITSLLSRLFCPDPHRVEHPARKLVRSAASALKFARANKSTLPAEITIHLPIAA